MKKSDLAKKMVLNAWGQDEKTAKATRKHLRQQKAFKSYGKHSHERFDFEMGYGKKGKGSLNPVQKSKDNMVMEGKNEQENA